MACDFFKNKHVGAPGLFTAFTGIHINWFAYGFFPRTIVLGFIYDLFAFICMGEF